MKRLKLFRLRKLPWIFSRKKLEIELTKKEIWDFRFTEKSNKYKTLEKWIWNIEFTSFDCLRHTERYAKHLEFDRNESYPVLQLQ